MILSKRILILAFILFSCLSEISAQTVVEIKGDQFYINGKPTYPGRTWNGYKVEGLLINSRMVQGIFDDLNPVTVNSFAYPDTKKWDANRNTGEFVAAMPEWHSYGLNCFTINMQGGSPLGYGTSQCLNPGFKPDGSLMKPYMQRLDRVLQQADKLQMVVILGIFYFGQDQYLTDETAVKNATKNLINWLFEKGYRNVIIEIANETNIKSYDHKILEPDRIHELIDLVKGIEKNDHRFLVGTSFSGITVPTPNVIKASDFLLIHGNGAKNPDQIQKLIDDTRKADGYRPMPIVNNEDDHYDFDKESNNFTVSIKNYCSWGYFDFRFPGETNYKEGYQSVPVDWGIHSERKKAFFNKVKEITGGNYKFESTDIGSPAIVGSSTIEDNTISIIAGGTDIWGTKDEFRFSYFEQTGDFDLVTRIESLTAPHLYTKAGLMAREELTDNSRHIFFQVFPNNNPRNKNNGGYEFQYRQAKAGEMKAIYPAKSDGVPEFPVNYPNTWIRLKRLGNDFTGFYSTDGKSWKEYTRFTMELSEKVYLGLAVTSHNAKESATAVFKDISLLKQ
jgi:hypothetical protein